MPKLNLKEIDFKQLLLQKGERFALWGMVGVMVLLVVLGVFVNGLSRERSATPPRSTTVQPHQVIAEHPRRPGSR